MENEKTTRDMQIYESRRGFFGVSVTLYKVSAETKKLEKTFSIDLKPNQGNPKTSDYKKIKKYIKENGINIINKEKFKWLE